MYAGLLAAQELLFSLGITAWQDAAVGRLFGLDDIFPIYLAAAALRRPQGARRRRPVVGARPRRRADPRARSPAAPRARWALRAPPASRSCRTASPRTSPPRCSSPTSTTTAAPRHNSGLSFVDPIALRDHVTQLDAAGFQVHFHALGDRAVREALDAVEAARDANGPTDGRHHLAHLQVVHPDDVPRFAELGAVANIQPLWAAHEPQMDELTIPFLGERPRRRGSTRSATCCAAGSRLAAGSDWSVSSPNPLDGIHVAVNRVAPGDGPASRCTRTTGSRSREALTAYTAGSAYVNHLDEVDRAHRGRLPRRSRRPRPRRLRLPDRPDRRRPGRRDLRRRRTRLLRHLTRHARTLADPTPEVPADVHPPDARPLSARPVRRLTAALLLAACSGTANSDSDSAAPSVGGGAAYEISTTTPGADRRHRLLHLVAVRRAAVAGLPVRLRLPAQHGPLQRLREPAALERRPVDLARSGLGGRQPRPDHLGLHDPRRRHLPRRQPPSPPTTSSPRSTCTSTRRSGRTGPASTAT